MIYKFTIVSDEVDDFVREIQIDPDATFMDLHKAILSSVGYREGELASFFICDDGWEKETEITLEEMDSDSDVDTYVMDETPLSDLIEEEKQRLIYVFDYMTDRCFFIELTEIITFKTVKEAVCTRSQGEAPVQTISFDEMEKKVVKKAEDLGEDFYGDQDYDLDDLDKDGFEGLDSISDSVGIEDIY